MQVSQKIFIRRDSVAVSGVYVFLLGSVMIDLCSAAFTMLGEKGVKAAWPDGTPKRDSSTLTGGIQK